jgi:hypothetical protein
MPRRELWVRQGARSSSISGRLRVVDLLRRAREGAVDEAGKKMAAEYGHHLRPPVEVVVVAETSSDERREVERRRCR